MGSNERASDAWKEPIAIIGLAANVPGAATSTEFWRLLETATSARQEIPKERFNADAFYHKNPDRSDAANVRHGHFLGNNIAAFDAPFFTIQANEAASMDPQQRLLLETSYHAIENAGIPMESLAGSRTAVYIGTSSRDYESILIRDSDQPSKYIGTGIGTSLIANRVSWFFDLRGPSLAVDTGCSGSLVALHHACQALHSGEVEAALVGGVNLIISPDVALVHLSNMGFFSPDGICYSFDARANGYSKGEGLGVVMIKRLSDAISAGDTIRAVIRATSSNQDGHTPGLTVPSKEAQVKNMLDTYRIAGLQKELDATAFFEAHGTGTQAGDTIEADAIRSVFGRSSDNPLYVGALKSSIGHLEAASGIAGLIKVVLTLEHGIIPPNLWFERPNPKIPADEWGLKFPLSPTPWPDKSARRASLNSFGYGGTNAHAIIEGAESYLHNHCFSAHHNSSSPRRDPTSTDGALINGTDHTAISATESRDLESEPRLLVFSAADETSLGDMMSIYEAEIEQKCRSVQDREAYIDRLSLTLARNRSRLPWKLFSITNHCSTSQPLQPVRTSQKAGLIMIFNGQGAQYARMGLELLAYPAFKNSLVKADEVIHSHGSSWSLLDELSASSSETKINTPLFSQPICTALQIALLDLLSSWSIYPSFVLGHSSGEIASAYSAGALSFSEAIGVAYFRGLAASHLEDRLAVEAAMSSVAKSSEEIAPVLESVNTEAGEVQVQVGCVNSNKNVTLTGIATAIEQVNAQMAAEGVFARRLAVTVPYHSRFMDSVETEYRSLLERLDMGSTDQKPRHNLLDRPRPQMVSSVTGLGIGLHELRDPAYWVKNLISPVLFSAALKTTISSTTLEGNGRSYQILEVGPHAVLQRPVKDILESRKENSRFEYQSLLERGKSSLDSAFNVIGRLWCKNVNLDPSRIRADPSLTDRTQPLVDLPPYPFNHSTTHWHEGRLSKNYRFKTHSRNLFLGSRVADWNPSEPRWRNIIRASEHPWLQNCNTGDSLVYPTGGLLVMAIQALQELSGYNTKFDSYEFGDVILDSQVLVPEASETEVQINLRVKVGQPNHGPQIYEFFVYNFATETPEMVVHGCLYGHESDTSIYEHVSSYQDMLNNHSNSAKEQIDASQYYTNLAEMDYTYGKGLRRTLAVHYNSRGFARSLVQMERQTLDDEKDDLLGGDLHPLNVEALLQSSIAAISNGSATSIPTTCIASLERVWLRRDWRRCSLTTESHTVNSLASVTSRGLFNADIALSVTDQAGELCMAIDKLTLNAKTSFASCGVNKDIHRHAFALSWKPDLALLSREELGQILKRAVPSQVEAASEQHEDYQELVCVHFCKLVLAQLSPQEVHQMPSHFQRYMTWMKHVYTEEKYQNLLAAFPAFEDPDGPDTFERTINFVSPASDLMLETGRALMPILRGEASALDLLFKTDLAERYYANTLFQRSYAVIAEYLDLCAHKNPALKVLEIGAGTGGATMPIMKVLGGDNKTTRIPRFSEYAYTDISPAFFDKAKDRFAPVNVARMRFAILDIEKDVLSQGFDAGHYDIVVCSGVLHICAQLDPVLSNVRQLLRPGGKLVMFEPTNPESCRAGFTFGLLPAWWSSQEAGRELSPLVDHHRWDEALGQNGFKGLDIYLPTFPDVQKATHTVFIASADTSTHHTAEATRAKDIIFVTDAESSYQSSVVDRLGRELDGYSADNIMITLADLMTQPISDQVLVFLLELEKATLKDITTVEWDALKTTMDQAGKVVWATRGCGQVPSDPDVALVTGFGRSMMTEKLGIHFTEIALSSTASLDHICHRLQQILKLQLADQSDIKESEYAEMDGNLCIGRLLSAGPLNQWLHKRLLPDKAVPEQLSSVRDRKLDLTAELAGDFQSFYFDETEHGFSSLVEEEEVTVEIQATALGPLDSSIARGEAKETGFGIGCSGIITEVGPANGSRLQIGDRVCFCAPGCLTNFARISTLAAVPMHQDQTFEQAASAIVAFGAAYYALVSSSRVQSGDTLLVRPARSMVGDAVIHFARLSGADVYVIVLDDEERSRLKETFSLTEDHVLSMFSYARLSIDVDIVLDCAQPGDKQHTLVSRVFCSRFVRVATASSYATSDRNEFVSDFQSALRKGPKVLDKVLAGAAVLLRKSPIPQGLLSTSPHIFSLNELANAFAKVQDTLELGGVVVSFRSNGECLIPIVPKQARPLSLERDATYVVGGGTGGIGRAIVFWLVDHGARHIVLLSRSGASSSTTKDFLEEISAQHVDIRAYRCDLSSEDSVHSALDAMAECMPPVRGVIQSVMDLREGILINLTADDWHAGIRPKVQGSWNLHSQLPRNLDFFVNIASVAGVTGCRSQANYNSACTYQDALARFRHSIGERAFSIDLGVMTGVGYAAELHQTDMLTREGYLPMRKEVLFKLLEYCCDPETPINSPEDTQLVVGLDYMNSYVPGKDGGEEVYWARNSNCAVLRQINAVQTSDDPAALETISPAMQIRAASSEGDAADVVLEILSAKLSRLMSVPIANIDAALPIFACGIDSLVALEIRYWLQKELAVDLAVPELMTDQSLQDLARNVTLKSEFRSGIPPDVAQ